MKFKLEKKITDKSGAALLWTLLMFFVFLISVPSIILIGRQDISETDWHTNKTESYYVALAGVEIGYAALMQFDTTPGPQYIDRFDASKSSVTHTQVITESGTTIGTAVITIENVTIDSKRWIQIESIGTVDGSTYSNTSTMRIDPDNYEHIIRESTSN